MSATVAWMRVCMRASAATPSGSPVQVRDGETKSIPARYSLTYVKDGNDWTIVDHHSSAVPAPPK